MKKISLLLVAFIILLAGCSGNSTPAEDLVLWGGFTGSEEEAINQVLEIYNEQNGNSADVIYESQQDLTTKLVTAMSTGDGPDIVIFDGVNTLTYAEQGAFIELDSLIEDAGLDTTQYYESSYNQLNIDGKQYGLPATIDARVLFYNKDLFDKAGIDYPTDSWTWEDMYEAANACTVTTNGNLEVSGFDLSDTGLFNMWMYQAGGIMADESTQKMSFNNEQGLSVLNEWQKYLDAGIYKNGYIGGENGIQDALAAGKVCMKYDGPWALTSLKEQGTNFGTVIAPAGPGGSSASMVGGFSFNIPTTTSDEQGSFDFINWWTTSDEAAETFYNAAGHLPANKETIQIDSIQSDENVQTIIKQFDSSIARPKVIGYGDAEYFGLKPNLDQFIAGELTAEEALSKGEAEANELLESASV